MFEILEKNLSGEELKIVAPIERLNEGNTECTFINRKDFLEFNFTGKNKQHCPFELYFGRNEHLNKFNFYFGLSEFSVEFYNYDDFSDPGDAEKIKQDIELFLKSQIRVHFFSRKNKIKKVAYYPDKLSTSENPISFQYNPGFSLPFFKKDIRTESYAPWIK